MTDENGVSRITQVDGLGRVTSACEVSSSTLKGVAPVACGQDIPATGFLTSYSYPTASGGNQVTMVAQGSQTRTFITDSLGRPVSVTEPERGATNYQYAYNATGLKVTRTRPEANQTNPAILTTTTTQYDALGRVVSIGYADNDVPSASTSNKSFVYDTICCTTNNLQYVRGRLAVMGAFRGPTAEINPTTSEFSYNVRGQIVNMWNCAPSTCGTAKQESRPLGFTYDWAGNLTSEGDAVSGQVAYTRSPAGEVTSINNNSYNLTGGTGGSTPIASNIINGPNGPVSYTLGNGLNLYKGYDFMGRPDGQWLCRGGPAAAYCASGGTQAFGQGETIKGSQVSYVGDTVLGLSTNYSYDEFNRLTSRTVTNGVANQNYTYSYDRYGNRWSQNGAPSFSASFDPTSNKINSGGYTYDAAGNMTKDGYHSYTYDAEGNIVSVDGGSTASYTYDALNRRVSVATPAGTSEYSYDYAGRRISTWNAATNNGTDGRMYWDGQQIAFRSSDNATYFENQDYIGTERIRTDHNGTTSATYKSLPWGDGYVASILNTETDVDNFHFADMEQDSNDAGAPMSEHAQFRNYSFYQGRWLSPDPYVGSYDITNPESLNRYAYVLNNPLSFLDPSGLDPCSLPEYDGNPCIFQNPPPPPSCDENPLACFGYGGNGYCWYFGLCGSPPSNGGTGGGSGAPSLGLCCINFTGRSSLGALLDQAATAKMSNSLFTNRISSLTCGLQVRQCPRRIIRITSKPLIVAGAVLIV
ncbi:cell wall-associated protein precursor [Acidisarcina polymorpha]|uniref:Cell wall-associated protein n=1 Tax=Acidisarcina polymorpha TaxID=2211140 RepID=A0A2Z5G4U9_9BACT|nr:cell wall-associated protein precursor [Acidisarcina polymorpha]